MTDFGEVIAPAVAALVTGLPVMLMGLRALAAKSGPIWAIVEAGRDIASALREATDEARAIRPHLETLAARLPPAVSSRGSRTRQAVTNPDEEDTAEEIFEVDPPPPRARGAEVPNPRIRVALGNR